MDYHTSTYSGPNLCPTLECFIAMFRLESLDCAKCVKWGLTNLKKLGIRWSNVQRPSKEASWHKLKVNCWKIEERRTKRHCPKSLCTREGHARFVIVTRFIKLCINNHLTRPCMFDSSAKTPWQLKQLADSQWSPNQNRHESQNALHLVCYSASFLLSK